MGQSISPEILVLLMILIIFLFIFATLKTDPYKLASANLVEIFSLIVCVITIFSTLVFISQTSDWFQMLVAVFCIGFNIFFFVFVGGIAFLDVVKGVKLMKRSKTGKEMNVVHSVFIIKLDPLKEGKYIKIRSNQ